MTTTPDDPADLVDRLLKAVGPAKAMEFLTKAIGSKGKVRQLVNAAKARGYSTGRPKEFFRQDVMILLSVEMVERSFRHAGWKVPPKRRLIKGIIEETILQDGLQDGSQFGATKDAAIKRIERHFGLMEMFNKTVKSENDAATYALEILADEHGPAFLEQCRKIDPSLEIPRFMALAFLLLQLC
jgi:hypothetical protein